MNSDFRYPCIIQKEIRELELANQSAYDWAETHPDDTIIKELISQSSERKTILLCELEKSLKIHKSSYLKYAFKADDVVNVSTIITQLSAFTEVINKTASAICNSRDFKMPLYLNTVVQSSFGLLLSTDNDDDLFGGIPVRAFDKFFEILTGLTSPSEELYKLFMSNEELLRAYRKFFKNSLTSEYDIEIAYGSYRNDFESKSFLSKKQLNIFYTKLADYEKNTLETESIEGSVQGVDLIHHSILVVPSTQKSAVIKIFFPEDMLDTIKPLLGQKASLVFSNQAIYDVEKNINRHNKTLIDATIIS